MFDVIMLLFVITIIFGGLFFVYKGTTKINKKYSENNIGKIVASFPISYKMSGYVVRIADKYYLCIENCGIVEIDYPESLGNILEDTNFQAILTKQLEKINIINKKIKS